MMYIHLLISEVSKPSPRVNQYSADFRVVMHEQ